MKGKLPEDLVTHVTATCGARGVEWIERLPTAISKLESQWSVTVGAPFPGGEFNFVAPAETSDGEAVVIKIAPPFESVEIYSEAKWLKLRDGARVVRLIAEDRDDKAILIERALPGEALFRYCENDAAGSIAPAIEVLRAILRPAPADMTDIDTLDAWFERFKRFRETEFSQDKAEKALGIYERLSKQPDRIYYLHGDFHPGNIVTSDRGPFLAIDPKGIVGHLGYDIAVFLNNLFMWQKDNPNVTSLLDAAISRFAKAFGFELTELREWSFAYMVIGAWWNFDDMPEHYDAESAMSDIWEV